jgi:hypothetical protein
VKRNHIGGMTEQDMQNHFCIQYAEKVGEVEVRSGAIVIGDAVSLGQDATEVSSSETTCRRIAQGQLFDTFGTPYAVSSEAGLGNGRYPVFSQTIVHPEFGTRVVALHVPLWPEYCLPKIFAEAIATAEARYISELSQPVPPEVLERYRQFVRAQEELKTRRQQTERRRSTRRKRPNVSVVVAPPVTESETSSVA